MRDNNNENNELDEEVIPETDNITNQIQPNNVIINNAADLVTTPVGNDPTDGVPDFNTPPGEEEASDE
jgi:hypothetical protein